MGQGSRHATVHAASRRMGPATSRGASSSPSSPASASSSPSPATSWSSPTLGESPAPRRLKNDTTVLVKDLTFHPPGSEAPLLSGVNMTLSARSLNLIIGRSGSGKTTLLQLLAGLCEQTSGEIHIRKPSGPARPPVPLLPDGSTLEQRMQQVGLVFQFPERHFLGETVASELSFAWPPSTELRWEMSNRAQSVLAAVGLSHVPLHLPPYALSGGQQRRLALAVQLIRQPSLLLLDEPLAGLDWQSRAEVAVLLKELKKQCTLLVVSHDLREVAQLVDNAWEMKLGGTMVEAQWPPPDLGKEWATVERRP
jgi:energy-coupling factor transport system ATP-binding protein